MNIKCNLENGDVAMAKEQSAANLLEANSYVGNKYLSIENLAEFTVTGLSLDEDHRIRLTTFSNSSQSTSSFPIVKESVDFTNLMAERLGGIDKLIERALELRHLAAELNKALECLIDMYKRNPKDLLFFIRGTSPTGWFLPVISENDAYLKGEDDVVFSIRTEQGIRNIGTSELGTPISLVTGSRESGSSPWNAKDATVLNLRELNLYLFDRVAELQGDFGDTLPWDSVSRTADLISAFVRFFESADVIPLDEPVEVPEVPEE